MNKRNAANPPSVTTNKTLTKVKQNYIFNQDPKNKKTSYTGLSISTTNKINVKEQDHNKRGNVPRNSSSKKNNDNEQTVKNEKVIKNNIQVQKVLLTDTATTQKKITQPQLKKKLLIKNRLQYLLRIQIIKLILIIVNIIQILIQQ